MVRWYDQDQGYENKLPYRAICSITWLGNTQVFLYGMHGKITKEDMKLLFVELALLGATHVVAERKGKFVIKDINFLLSRAGKTQPEFESV
jgi:hypothetical protein